MAPKTTPKDDDLRARIEALEAENARLKRHAAGEGLDRSGCYGWDDGTPEEQDRARSAKEGKRHITGDEFRKSAETFEARMGQVSVARPPVMYGEDGKQVVGARGAVPQQVDAFQRGATVETVEEGLPSA